MLYAIVAVIVLILDQAAKYWTSVNLAVNATSPFIPGFIQLTNVHNPGAAFGMLSGWRWLFVLLTVLVTIGVIYMLNKNIIKGKLGRWMLVLVVTGGIGNCIDRLINGYVVDMFQFQFKFPIIKDFAIFNVADIFITISGIIFCIYLIFHKETIKEPPAPAKPSRPMPRSTEPQVRADYISQLKRPVAEGRKNIEAELAAKAAEAARLRGTDSIVTDWSVSDFAVQEAGAKVTPATTLVATPVPAPAPKPTSAFSAERPATTAPKSASALPDFEEFFKEPAKPSKKSDLDFDLEDIIAEFKDK